MTLSHLRQNLAAGLRGGLTLTTINTWLPFPFQILMKLGLRWPMWERESHFLRRTQAVSAQRGQCEELLLWGRRWKWGPQQGLRTRDWLSWTHGCNTLQTGVRARR